MASRNHRIRLDDPSREVLMEVLDDAITLEDNLPRKALMIELYQRLLYTKPGHPIEILSMKSLSNAHYNGIGSTMRRAILEKRALGRCEKCGLAEPQVLEVDHIDANRTNNDPSNLMLLCANCHKRKGWARRVEAAKLLGVDVRYVQSW